MENMINESKKYLESDQGKQFESSLQNEFKSGRDDGPSQDNDDGDFSSGNTQGGRDQNPYKVDGNADQGADSNSGMNSCKLARNAFGNEIDRAGADHCF